MSSPKSKFLKVFFLARAQKSVITCHICTRFVAYSHSNMLRPIIITIILIITIIITIIITKIVIIIIIIIIIIKKKKKKRKKKKNY